MFDLRMVLPASPAMIRAWLIGLADRTLPLSPDPEGFGQPQLSHHAFTTDATLRPQFCPPEIEQAGGFAVGLEVAFNLGNGLVQPMGPVVVFMTTPMGSDRSEIRIFFPLGLHWESRPVMPKALREAWPGVPIYSDQMPWWMARGFNRHELFAAIATGSPPPPGAPPIRRRDDPKPWRDASTVLSNDSMDTSDDHGGPTGQDAEIVRLWKLGTRASQIAEQIGRETKTIENRIGVLRRQFGVDIVPYRRTKP